MKHSYTLQKGKQIIIWITATSSNYIGEITQEDPLIVKVTEDGPFSKLKDDDFIINLL